MRKLTLYCHLWAVAAGMVLLVSCTGHHPGAELQDIDFEIVVSGAKNRSRIDSLKIVVDRRDANGNLLGKEVDITELNFAVPYYIIQSISAQPAQYLHCRVSCYEADTLSPFSVSLFADGEEYKMDNGTDPVTGRKRTQLSINQDLYFKLQ